MLDDDEEEEGDMVRGVGETSTVGEASTVGIGGGGDADADASAVGKDDDNNTLLQEVMGFMGGGVWDIDEELRKMAGTGSPVKKGVRRKGRRK